MKLLVPDVIPNNIRAIRDNRGISVKKAADDLKIDRNFLCGVEMENKNFSGKTTVRVLKYYGISFYQMYDVQEVKVFPVTTLIGEEHINMKFCVDLSEIENVDINSPKNINSIVEKMILKHIIDLNASNALLSYQILNNKVVKNNLHVETTFKYLSYKPNNQKFDINFCRDENVKLADMLFSKGYQDCITYVDRDLDTFDIKIENDKVIFDREYKIPKESDVTDYYITNELPLNKVELKYDKTNDNNLISVRFKAIRPELNNLRFIREHLNLSEKDVFEPLDMLANSYTNLELGKQKISTKIMWKLVELFKLPLEAIINIDEYYDKFCFNSKKITKKRATSN